MLTHQTDTPVDVILILQELRRSSHDVESHGPVKRILLNTATVVVFDPMHLGASEYALTANNTISDNKTVLLVSGDVQYTDVLSSIECGNYWLLNPDKLAEGMKQLCINDGGTPPQSRQEPLRTDGRPGKRSIDNRMDGCSSPKFRSAPMLRLDAELQRLARFDYDVLLIGETGTGKDVAAHRLHSLSHRKSRPFITIPISSLCDTLIESELFGHVRGAFSGANRGKQGKLESAQGGTIYLPEISSLDHRLQLKLLYFMQYKRCHRVGEDPGHRERHCDVRLVLASNEGFSELVSNGRIREDFYYRIKGLSLELPPLRERRAAIPELALHFLQKHAPSHPVRYSLDDEAVEWLKEQSWPGNIRELEGTVRAAVTHVRDGRITVEVLKKCHNHDMPRTEQPHGIAELEGDFPRYSEFTSCMQKRYIEEALQRCDGCISRAAVLSGLSLYGFRKAMARLGVASSTSRDGLPGETYSSPR